jgi:hypothetical protein
MPKIRYVSKSFREDALGTIARAEAICDAYAAQGFSLTLRQLYYQFVSRGWIANKDSEYKRLGSIINDARLAGLIDWDHLEDRTRNVRDLTHWDSPASIMRAVAAQFRYESWNDQPMRVVVMIEKDALVGVIENVCQVNDVPFFSCRGYVSQSEMWAMARRFVGWIRNGQQPIVLHLGDHDPSGLDMSEDIDTRLSLRRGSTRVDSAVRMGGRLRPGEVARGVETRLPEPDVRQATSPELGSDSDVQPATEPGESDRRTIQ